MVHEKERNAGLDEVERIIKTTDIRRPFLVYEILTHYPYVGELMINKRIDLLITVGKVAILEEKKFPFIPDPKDHTLHWTGGK